MGGVAGRTPWILTVVVSSFFATFAAGGAEVCSFEHVDGQGDACAVDGGWLVRLANGGTVFTHGPDAAPASDDGDDEAEHHGSGVSPTWPPRGAWCVPNQPNQPYGVLVYARPSNAPDRYVAMAPEIRSMFHVSAGLLRREAEEFAHASQYKMLCDGWGLPVVVNAALQTPASSDSFGSIVNDLQAMGYGDANAKYWVWYDNAVACGCGGQGSINNDDRPGPENANNAGPDYGITYGFVNWDIMMHENGHNLGAVQLSAPNTSGGWHCDDGQDVMCYDDGAPGSDYDSNVCSTRHFDCNHDDYFRPNPAAGSYLATKWNLGGSSIRHIQNVALSQLPSEPRTVQATPTSPNAVQVKWVAPATDGGSPITGYRIYRGAVPQSHGSSVVPTTFYLLDEQPHTVTGPEIAFTDVVATGRLYSYRVAALTAVGEGALSARAFA